MERRPQLSPPRPPSELSWCPLAKHPVFERHARTRDSVAVPAETTNIAAWNAAASRLYLWDPHSLCVHRLSLRFADTPDHDPDGSVTPIEAASPSEILLTEVHINFPVTRISLNREGSALLLASSGGLFVMYVYDRLSSKDNSLVCRTVSVGSEASFLQNGLRIMDVSWHSHSSTHICVLSSDSVLRLYDLSSNLKQPEQEYYLQPTEPGQSNNLRSKTPVSFSFGGEHLWDRFSVFILFSDGSVYVLCPLVPFGSTFTWSAIEEIYEDINMFGLKSSTAKSNNNSWLAISWIESTFPDVVNKATMKDNLPGSTAHAYVPMDASLSLQGPLRKVSDCMGNGNETSVMNNGQALGFLYNSVGKDSILVIAWSSGQLQIDALADEFQPLWTTGISPRIRVDSRGRTLGAAMICESNPEAPGNANLMLSQGAADNVWLGNSPPLLSLAIVDLALPKSELNKALFYLFSDPIASERIYCVHNGGIDMTTLHFLPFSSTKLAPNDTPKPPTVCPILGACDSETSKPVVCGAVALVDPFGDSQIIAITPSYDCILLEVKRWSNLSYLQLDLSSVSVQDSEVPAIISREILDAPKEVLVPDSSSLRSLSTESIEGRSALHHYTNIFHEHYEKYAHKVYVELKHHGDFLKANLDTLHTRLLDVSKILSSFEAKQKSLINQVNRALEGYTVLEGRMQNLRSLPGLKRKPLSRAEREFKAQLERLSGQELDSLHMSVEALKSRLRRFMQSSSNGSATTRPVHGKRNQAPDAQISELMASIAKLSLMNSENTKKVKIIEHALKDQLDT